MPQILVLEDEESIRQMLAFALGRAGFEVTQASNSEDAEHCLYQQLPDMVLVDWMLPGMSGLEFIRRLRRDPLTQKLPVIMLTARSQEDDKILGLESGADDYLSKPFSPRELIARVKALLRRSDVADGEAPLTHGPLRLDPVAHRLDVNGTALQLGPTEYRLLHFFMGHVDRVYSRAQLLDLVWGRNTYIEERTVDVHILRLRKALVPFGCDKLLQTVRGAGYRFVAEV